MEYIIWFFLFLFFFFNADLILDFLKTADTITIAIIMVSLSATFMAYELSKILRLHIKIAREKIALEMKRLEIKQDFLQRSPKYQPMQADLDMLEKADKQDLKS